jgi:hypothetical protein
MIAMIEKNSATDSLLLIRKIVQRSLGIAALLGCTALPVLVHAQLFSPVAATPPPGGPTIVQVPAQVPGQLPSQGPGQPSRSAPGSSNVPPGFWGPGAPGLPLDQAMESPIFKRILSLMEENLELKSELRVQAIQSEAREQLQSLKAETKMLREQLERSQEALRQATVAKESLEKRITELDHRSRLLEERAKSMVERQSEAPSLDRLTKFLNELQTAFDQHLQKIQLPAKETRGRKSSKDSKEQRGESINESNN